MRGGRKIAALLATLACSSPPRPAGELRTMSDLVADAQAKEADGTASVVLRAQPIKWLSDPYNPGTQLQEPDRDGLIVQPAFADARPAAFVTTEIWDGFPRVWAQPMYVFVTGFDAQGPQLVPNAKSVFAFDTASRFYSPYWQTWWVTVPAGFDVDSLRTAEQVLGTGFPLTQGPLRFAALGPREIEVAHPVGDPPIHPFTKDVLLERLPAQAWAQGNLVWAIDFGADRFRINAANNVVQEVALFRLAFFGADGTPQPIEVPPIVGTGPFGTPRAADAPNGFPRFGALRHEYLVNISPGAGQPMPGVFVSASNQPLRDFMIAKYGTAFVPKPSGPAELLPERDQYTLRVAVDGSCFLLTDFPNSCIWFDTQQSIEGNLRTTVFTDTRRFSSGALVFFDGVAP
jgi:hypothetical protein